MRRRVTMLLVLLAVPGAAAASAGADPSGGTAAPDGSPRLAVRPGALLGRATWVRGTLAPRATIVLQRLDASGWKTVAEAVTTADGGFAVRWRPDRAGHVFLRAVTGDQSAVAQAADIAVAQVTIYRPARATWYGPGFYGRRTACGVRLTRAVVGVAHRSLPCGTLVDVLYRGRRLTVPVIDRGPFAHHARWDLTGAAARLLGVRTTSRIGVLANQR